MSAPPPTPKEFGRRFRKALSVPFLLNQVCSPTVQQFVTPYASALGVTEKCLFLPLLSCAASCLGTESCVELTPHWKEPPVVWTLVLCPRSLQRVDVAEHLKQCILKAQDRALVLGRDEDTKEYLKKFLFDEFSLDKLQDALKLSGGWGLALYNSPRPLHPSLEAPHHTDILHRMLNGQAWFTDSRVSRMTLTKTRVNFSVLATPSSVQQELASSPHFHELFHQCFLVACSEESHVRFSQISEGVSEEDKLVEVFVSLMKLHSKGAGEPIVYKLGEEAREKFGQIHDELTDKAKQMARKNAHKVFQPALSYLVRLSLSLHVLDGVLDALHYQVPLSRLTWSTEITASTVWQARELLGHLVEQRHALMEPTTIEQASASAHKQPQVHLVDQHQLTPQQQASSSPRLLVTPTSVGRSPVQGQFSPRPSFSFNNVRRNIMNTNNNINRFRYSSNNNNNRLPSYPVTNGGISSVTPIATPIISSVSSAGVPVLPEAPPPALLSRPPSSSALEGLTEADFLSAHRSSLRRLLRHSASEVTPSRCVQLRLLPDPTASDDALRHTQGFARAFLKRVESLGFGLCDGPKGGNLRNFVFKKKKFSSLGEEQRRLLEGEVKVSEVEYNKCFTTAPPKEQNGGVVCLE